MVMVKCRLCRSIGYSAFPGVTCLCGGNCFEMDLLTQKKDIQKRLKKLNTDAHQKSHRGRFSS